MDGATETTSSGRAAFTAPYSSLANCVTFDCRHWRNCVFVGELGVGWPVSLVYMASVVASKPNCTGHESRSSNWMPSRS